MPDRWEYRIEYITNSLRDGETRLNELGRDGWELVTVVWTDTPGKGIFKRSLTFSSSATQYER